MHWFVIIVQLLVGGVMLWLFWPLLLAVAFSAACGFAVLWVLPRISPVGALLQRSSVLRMAVRLLVLLGVCGLTLGLLLVLPLEDRVELLIMACGAAAAVAVFVAVWTLAQTLTAALQWQRRQPAADCLPAEGWWIAGGIGSMATFFLVALLSPDTAGWLAWREQLRGYPATQLRISLLAGTPAQRAQLQQALPQLLQPLLEQGSRPIDLYTRSKHGTSHFQATVPARYRWQGDTLEVVMGGRLAPADLQAHLHSLQWLRQGSEQARGGSQRAWASFVWAQCAPQGGPRQQTWRLARSAQRNLCQRQRMALWEQLGPLLAGQVSEVQLSHIRHFRPWLSAARWTLPDLPAPQTLDARAH